MCKFFNIYWWKYFWNAGTIYQVHSPFLFEFATKICTPISGKLRPETTHGIRNLDLLKNSGTLTWIHHLYSLYMIKNLLILSGSPLEQLLLEDNFIEPINNTVPQNENLTFYRIIAPNNTPPNNSDALDDFTLGVLPVSLFHDEMVLSIVNQTGSCLFLVEKIHKNHEYYHRWCRIIKNSMFNFSVELYNFGFVFHHPVNQTPENITLIHWPWKPWNLITL